MRPSNLKLPYLEIFKFLSVGAFTAGINFLTLYLLLEWLTIDYRFAASVSFLGAAIFQFVSNYIWTFGSRDIAYVYFRFLCYCILLALNYCISMAVIVLVVEVLQASPYHGLILSLFIVTPLGFFLSKNWVYKN